ncbi:uncharacterized protein EI97DRAFT_436694 [Westerdykella ornata]|uniref:Uncharacterized protein n=1 Tax=Westerdykella ornata TaxID=318751 RepID=A0A6A6J9A7_WESOR|nr:uncharacterized protein EI97DRAFT_436694 [Westerdykella ornata]KAF2272763.1 hypothetical protein EI97DRAFT_436694 [Westerdykella ornata]
MGAVLSAIATIFYYATFPIVQVLRLVIFILSPFWTLTKFVLLPVTYAAHGIFAILLFPLRLRLLERLETLYIYVGIAGLIGCLVGVILHVIFNALSSTLAFNGAAEGRRTRPSTVAEYRAGRQRATQEEPYGLSASAIQKRRARHKQSNRILRTIADVDVSSDDVSSGLG